MITISTFAILLIFWNFLGIGGDVANQASCQMKYMNYCFRWVKDGQNYKPNDWTTVSPKEGCDKFNINEPGWEDCKKLYPY